MGEEKSLGMTGWLALSWSSSKSCNWHCEVVQGLGFRGYGHYGDHGANLPSWERNVGLLRAIPSQVSPGMMFILKKFLSLLFSIFLDISEFRCLRCSHCERLGMNGKDMPVKL